MPSKRDDYILRAIEQLRIMVAAAVKLRDHGQLDQALIALVSAQEKLFARPAQAFMGLELDEQLRLLRVGESAATASGKCLAYADLLDEAASIYEARDKQPHAEGARQSALYITLAEAIENPTRAAEISTMIATRLEHISVENLHPPVKELLDQVIKATNR